MRDAGCKYLPAIVIDRRWIGTATEDEIDVQSSPITDYARSTTSIKENCNWCSHDLWNLRQCGALAQINDSLTPLVIDERIE